MKNLSASNQKWLKGIHLVVAGLWLSCVILLLLLPLVGWKITGGDELYMYNLEIADARHALALTDQYYQQGIAMGL